MRYLVLVLKGMAYGITHIIPGMGGGLVLILLGIYEPFVDAIGNFFLRRDKWGEYIPFLLSLGLGMVITAIALARLASALLANHPGITMFFFMGLMLGTVPAVLKMHHDMRPSVGRILALLAGLALVVGVRSLGRLGIHGSLSSSLEGARGVIYTAATSFAAGCASVTPGLDGSYVLLLAGTYQPILAALSDLADLTIRWGTLAAFGLGAVLGIVTWSKAVDTAIKRAPSATYYCVLGLILGSPYGLWPSTTAGASVPVMALAFAAGFALALGLGRSEKRHGATRPCPGVEKVG